MSEQLAKRYHQIENIKKRYLEKITSVPEETFNKIPGENSWSIGQVMYHLYFSESGTIKVIQKNLRENKVKSRSGLSDLARNILLMFFLKGPFKFKAPAVAQKVPDTITKEEITKLFQKNTEEFKTILEELPSNLENKRIFKHPISGLFNINQTLNFVSEHYLHHEGQVNRLIKQ
jgi:uncharacterized damage-inducible protein DinB